MVAKLCGEIGIPHTTLRPASPLPAANLQALARAARYAAMVQWCAAKAVPFLLTAHHADDQAETLLLRLARGSGLGGMSGIRRMRLVADNVTLLRPLLAWKRADLRAVVMERGWQAVDDPSNSNPRFGRTHARTLLAETSWLDSARLASTAAHLSDAEEALGWAAEQAWASRLEIGVAIVLLDPEALPKELKRRLLLRGLAHLGTEAPDGPAVERAEMRLAAGGVATLGGVKLRALKSGRWKLTLAPARKSSRPA